MEKAATSEKKTFAQVIDPATYINKALKLPIVHIDRDGFLYSVLSKRYPQEIVDKAIKTTPTLAGLSKAEIERLAKSAIKRETINVTAISSAAGIPGKYAMIATIPADITQFFCNILRILQKLAYLYGWGDFIDEKGEFDDEAVNRFMLFLGVMMGVKAASQLVTKLASSIGTKLAKTIPAKALTKTAYYPIVKKIASACGLKMTKQIFGGAVGKSIPILGAVVSGGITFVSFTPMANKLRKFLEKLEFEKSTHEDNKNEKE